WVHETPPESGVSEPGPSRPDARRPIGSAGVSRLERAVEAARALSARGRHARAAHVLSRCAPALAARGALAAAAGASCDLGDLLLARRDPARAPPPAQPPPPT